MKALQEARALKDSAEVRSFFGLLNFSGRFFSHLATNAAPLRRLTQKNFPFKWEKEQEKAFQELKNSLEVLLKAATETV